MQGDAGRFSGFERGRKTRDILGFDRDDFCARLFRFDRERDPGQQPGTSNWDDHRVNIRNLLENFQPRRSLAGNNRWIVVAVDVSEALFCRDLMRVGLRFPKILAMEYDICAEFLTIVHFD